MKHPSDFMHVLVHHIGPLILMAVGLYTAIFLVIKLATRSNKRGKPKEAKAGELNRKQRRQQRAMKGRPHGQ